MRLLSVLALVGLLVCFTNPAQATPDGWHASLDKGLDAAKKSGKPLLVITAWQRTL